MVFYFSTLKLERLKKSQSCIRSWMKPIKLIKLAMEIRAHISSKIFAT